MRKRTGDWRDLLSAYAYALDVKKIYVGLRAVLLTVIIMIVAMEVYHAVGGPVKSLRELTPGHVSGFGDASAYMAEGFMYGTGLQKTAVLLPLLNPFGYGWEHFGLSLAFYIALFLVWGWSGGVISRLVALEYARDDLPTLGEARAMVSSRWSAYFLGPLMPLIVIAVLVGMNALGGVIASIPKVGPILLVFPGWPLLVATCVIMIFLIVFGVLSYGMMIPGVSVDGKDAFETWSTAYSYALWGLRRFICYKLILAFIGVIAAVVAWHLGELLIWLLIKTVNMGYLHAHPWVSYVTVPGKPAQILPLTIGTPYVRTMSSLFVGLLLLVRAIPVAYVFAYFFSANTQLYFLMRKDQDNIEVDEVYEEKPEEPAADDAAAAAGEQGAQGKTGA